MDSSSESDEGTTKAVDEPAMVCVPIVDGPAPCVRDYPSFEALVRRADVVHSRVAGKKSVKSRRFQLDCEIASFCHSCEVRRECLLIAVDNNHTGIAGGHVVRGGRVRSTLIPAPDTSTTDEDQPAIDPPPGGGDSGDRNRARRAV